MRIERLFLLTVSIIVCLFLIDRAIAVNEKQEKAARVDRVIDVVDSAVIILRRNAVDISHEEMRLIMALNTYRARLGLAPLTPDNRLMRSARERAALTNEQNVHFPRGESAGAGATKHGYSWSAVAENAAWEFPHNPASEAVNSWRQSPGHERAMRGSYTDVGVGIVKGTYRGQQGQWIIAVFARPDATGVVK